MMISPIPAYRSLSCPQFYRYLRTPSKSPLPIPPCHDEELIPSTAYTKYYVLHNPRSTVSRSQRVPHLSAGNVVHNSLH
jgi:hypothetical protein